MPTWGPRVQGRDERGGGASTQLTRGRGQSAGHPTPPKDSCRSAPAKLAESTYEADAVLTRPVVIGVDGQAVEQRVARFEREFKGSMVRNRRRVARRGDCFDCSAAGLPSLFEEQLVQLPADALAAPLRIDADEVNVRLVSVIGRVKPDEEPDQLATVFDDPASGSEMLQEQWRYQQTEFAGLLGGARSGPPQQDCFPDGPVISRQRMADVHRNRRYQA